MTRLSPEATASRNSKSLSTELSGPPLLMPSVRGRRAHPEASSRIRQGQPVLLPLSAKHERRERRCVRGLQGDHAVRPGTNLHREMLIVGHRRDEVRDHPEGVGTGAPLRRGVESRHLQEPVPALFPHSAADATQRTHDPLAPA
jgi:hypothetical protein